MNDTNFATPTQRFTRDYLPLVIILATLAGASRCASAKPTPGVTRSECDQAVDYASRCFRDTPEYARASANERKSCDPEAVEILRHATCTQIESIIMAHCQGTEVQCKAYSNYLFRHLADGGFVP